jgi:hypothetical protein
MVRPSTGTSTTVEDQSRRCIRPYWLDPQTRERSVEPNYYTASSSDQRLDHRLRDRKLETEDGSST